MLQWSRNATNTQSCSYFGPVLTRWYQSLFCPLLFFYSCSFWFDFVPFSFCLSKTFKPAGFLFGTSPEHAFLALPAKHGMFLALCPLWWSLMCSFVRRLSENPRLVWARQYKSARANTFVFKFTVAVIHSMTRQVWTVIEMTRQMRPASEYVLLPGSL